MSFSVDRLVLGRAGHEWQERELSDMDRVHVKYREKNII